MSSSCNAINSIPGLSDLLQHSRKATKRSDPKRPGISPCMSDRLAAFLQIYPVQEARKDSIGNEAYEKTAEVAAADIVALYREELLGDATCAGGKWTAWRSALAESTRGEQWKVVENQI